MREAFLFKLFLDLQKSYDALDWDIRLEIIAAYVVIPRTLRILQTYWGRLTMVARAGGYFGLPFKGYRGVTQCDPLSPTLFNVVVDAVIRHWVTVVAEIEAGTEVLGLLIQYFVPYFYSDDGLAASTQPERLQRVFTVLTGLFCQFGLRTNTRKTVRIGFQTCHMPDRMSVVAY